MPTLIKNLIWLEEIGGYMKLKACLLLILGFYSCTEKTQEQQELEEIVEANQIENVEWK